MSILLEVQRWLKEKMDENLYHHSIASSELAVEIARRYKADEEKAQIAALIHDCAKIYSPKELLDFAKAFNIQLDDIEKENPSLLHALIGVDIFEKAFGTVHSSIKRAVRLHTTGDANMEILDKVIYVSDSLEPNRHYPGLIQIREIARRDLDYSLYMILQRKIQHSMESRKQIHPRVLSTWNWIIPLIKTKKY
ncbi:MAG: bis(5'-nucleosyl)-tetraphosphatase (symmetrical) YqeK [Candidatus Firestonebacteria bacterium]|nr:bis(5'-nucleosyl)-tetraphosphatase (symmetrical) YqeK [Candidatus Firestonebacteria bacterium]